MNSLEYLVRKEVMARGGKIPTLERIKWGRAISVVAALPLFTSWMFLFSIPMMMPMSPTLWAKTKIKDFHTWRMLR